MPGNKMIDWQKLRREWKTFALAIAGIILEIYDALIVTGLIDLPAVYSDEIRPWMKPAFLIGMLLLRKWRDANQPT
jgi:hypothetical protein